MSDKAKKASDSEVQAAADTFVQQYKPALESLAKVERLTVEAVGRAFPVEIHKDPESDWWIGRCPSILGCVTQGETRAELLEMLADAITQCLAVLDEDSEADGQR